MPEKTRYLVRPATLDDVVAIATVNVESWRSSYRDILPQDVLRNLSVEGMAAAWKQNLANPRRVTHVGTTGDGKIVGFCGAGPNRDEPKSYDGEVYAIYLLDEAKRQGLGRALFIEAADSLRQKGLPTLLVWVLTGNPAARKFYEALGGRSIAEKPLSIGGVPYSEVAYGWTGDRPPLAG